MKGYGKDSSGSEYGPLVSSHEHGNGLQVAKKAGYFLIN
jgi:hypothetical protein